MGPKTFVGLIAFVDAKSLWVKETTVGLEILLGQIKIIMSIE